MNFYYAASKEKNMKRAKKTIIQRSKKKIFSEQRKNIQQAKKKIIQWPSTLSKGKIMLLFAVTLFLAFCFFEYFFEYLSLFSVTFE